jgi:hypothetical protein
MKNIKAGETPSMTEAETNWKLLWGEKTQHNVRAEWIRREQRRKISNMNCRHIQITDITLHLSKAHNWKSPGNCQMQISGLKFAQLPAGIEQNTSMQ